MNKSEALLKHYAIMNIARELMYSFATKEHGISAAVDFEYAIHVAEKMYEIQEKRQQEIMKEFEDEK